MEGRSVLEFRPISGLDYYHQHNSPLIGELPTNSSDFNSFHRSIDQLRSLNAANHQQHHQHIQQQQQHHHQNDNNYRTSTNTTTNIYDTEHQLGLGGLGLGSSTNGIGLGSYKRKGHKTERKFYLSPSPVNCNGGKANKVNG